jgi:hypothetical protein
MDFQCDDRDCFVEYKVQYNCVTYYSTNDNCSIPCRLEFCKTKLLHEVLCAVYHCKPSTSSTSTTTVTSITTTTPDGTTTHDETGNIVSYCFNVFAFFFFAAFCSFYLRKFFKKSTSPSQVPLLNENERAARVDIQSVHFFRNENLSPPRDEYVEIKL